MRLETVECRFGNRCKKFQIRHLNRADSLCMMFHSRYRIALKYMKCLPIRTTGVVICCVFPLVSAFSQDVVISEIMYQPSSNLRAEEYIEIHNRGTLPVSLQGWRFDRGIDYVFTNNVVLAPGAYWVVAADRTAFQAKYSAVTNVSGNWTGSLANGGESIRLEDAAGNDIDRVSYADEGDWATRIRGPNMGNGHRGWDWQALHDGLGSSLEVVNLALSNDSGQNWEASTVPNGTPGVVNSVRATDLAPMILEASHTPAIPSSSDPVVVRCRILDELNAQGLPLIVALRYRTDSGTFLSTTMFDDGLHSDGQAGDYVYAAILPAQPHLTVMEFYIEATDGDHLRTWPAAALIDGTPSQACNMLYQVDDNASGDSPVQPTIRLIMTEAERAELASGTIRNTDAQMNATMISKDGVETRIRYNAGARIRGAGSRGATVPNYRVNIPSDRLWNGVEAFNLNSQYPYSQVIGSELAIRAGLPAAQARVVQVRVNGSNLALGGAPQYGAYALLEVPNSDWAANHFPLDPQGNIYRGSTGNHSATMDYLPPFSGATPSPVQYTGAGYLKNSNQAENDWSDMFRLTQVMSTNATDAVYEEAVRANANVEQWMRYFAVFTLFNSTETSFATGRGDDWAAYRGFEDPRFVMVPHDLDSIFGQGGGGTTENLFRMVPDCFCNVWRDANTTVLNRFMRFQTFVPSYYSELKRLADSTFSSGELDPVVDRLLSDWVPAQNISSIKQFAAARAAFVLSQIPQTYLVSTGLPVSDGYFRTTIPTISLNGSANAIDTRRVLVNDLPATYVAWQGTWSISSVPLNPGINQVRIVFLGENDVEVHRSTVEVWYDDSSVATLSGPVVDDVVLSPGSGPYRVNGTFTVPSGFTLQVLPGTTVYFASGASLNIQGRLVAEGTEPQRIRFTREPNSGGGWSGINFNNTQEDNRIAHADIAFASNADSITLNNSRLLVDHVTWSNTLRTILDLSNSSLIVRNSIFPTIDNNETIHGVTMPADGYVIIESNYFGGTTGYSDIIDFTGGQRPGPILQVYHNTFNGGSDDALDLDGTDAHIEGNVFMNIHQDATRDSGSYAIATDDEADLMVVRNIFFNIDHALLLKNGARATFQNNTVYGIRTNAPAAYPAAVISFGEPDRNVAGGAEAILDGNIFWGIDQNRHFLFFTNGVMNLEVDYSLLSGTNHPGLGNLSADPKFLNDATNTITFASILSDLALLPGSPAVGTGPNGLDMGALVPGGVSVSGVPASPSPSDFAVLLVSGPGMTEHRYSLNGELYSGQAPVDTPIVFFGLSPGPVTVSVIGRNSAGVWQDTNQATVVSWTVDPSVTALRLSEVLAWNTGGVVVEDPTGDFTPDIIELYNGGSSTLNLEGIGLSDDPAVPYKYKFPAGVSLEAGQYLVLYADDRTQAGGIHLGFGLDQTGDAVCLHDRAVNGGGLLDAVTFGIQLPNFSVGRLGTGPWRLNRPTPGTGNVPEGTGDASLVVLNEWGTDGLTAYDDDFVELYNPDACPVDLGGYFLTDNIWGWPTRHRIQDLSFLAAKGHVAFKADGNTESGADHLSFQLSPDQGELALYGPSTNLLDSLLYGPQSTDESEGLRPSGSNLRAIFGASTMTVPTPGAPNPGVGGTITTSNVVVDILPMATSWRYNRDGTDQGTAWQAPSFNDSAWSIGAALLGVENAPLPSPGLNTVFPGYNNNQITYYFRTAFEVSSNYNGFSLEATTVLDDGAVIYLNGVEVARPRMPAGTITFLTQAQGASVGDATEEVLPFPAGIALALGTNVLAVEVHQANIPSSDLVWGMSLRAYRTVTNITLASVVINEVMAQNITIPLSGPDTNVTDWVELFNPGDLPLDLSDFSLSDDVGDPRRWVFPAGSSIGAGQYLLVRFDSAAPASTNTTGILNTGFGLGSGGDEVFLFNHLASGGGLLDSIAFGLQAADFTVGRFPNASGPWRLNLPTPGSDNLNAATAAASNVKINEWMADPSGGDDDYFELYNPNPQPADLGGLYLTDDLTQENQYAIPPLSFIGIGLHGFAVFIADNDSGAGPDHVNFGLSRNGESIGLFRANGSAIDTVVFGPQENGVSEGRFPNGADTRAFFPGTATPGASNIRPLEEIVISEALTHSDLPYEDAIELHNISPGYVDLSGWYLSDTPSDPKRYRIPDGTVVAPGGFVVFYEAAFNTDTLPPSFSLSSVRGDDIVLSTADLDGDLTGYQAAVDFGPAANGVSFGRVETSVDVEFVARQARTFGVDNAASVEAFRTGTGLSNALPMVGPVVISEIMYHPTDPFGTNENDLLEFIELRNITGSIVPLYDTAYPTNSWRLRDAVRYAFPSGYMLPAQASVVLVGFDPMTEAAALDTFRSTYGIGPEVAVLGPWEGALGNGGEDVELVRPDTPQPPGSPDEGEVPAILVDRVEYQDSGPWSTVADGSGSSLQRLVLSSFGNEPANWTVGTPTPGNANVAKISTAPTFQSQPASVTVNAGAFAVLTTSLAPGAAQPVQYQWLKNGRKLVGQTNSFLNLTPASLDGAGAYRLLAYNSQGAALSQTATVVVQAPPQIVKDPVSRIVSEGATVVFTVAVRGSQPMSFQWYKDAGAVTGATGPVIQIADASTSDEGAYTVEVSNGLGSATSAAADLYINQPPNITAQPQSQTVFVGESASFSVTATGTPPLSYVWRLNGAVLPGQGGDSLQLDNVDAGDGGTYTVTVINSVGNAVSDPATLTVEVPPTLTIVASDADASEPSGNDGAFQILRAGSTNYNVTINLLVWGTATPGGDYAAIASTFFLPAGAISGTIPVTVLDDAEPEGTELVAVSLLPGAGYLVDTPDSALVSIQDEDNVAPSVAILNPIADTLFTAPANVVIQASASDSDGTVASVSFYADGTNFLGSAMPGNLSVTWTNAPVGPHVLTAVALDNLGSLATSAGVPILVNAAPAVAITSPGTGSFFLDPADITITATASDADGSVQQVEFLQGALILFVDDTPPYEYTWPGVVTGNYTLQARATDDRGVTSVSAPVNVSVGDQLPFFADLFADRGLLLGYTNFVTGNNSNYAKEAGEPNHAGLLGPHTAWITWLSPGSGTCTMDTFGSSFDTVLAVYTGSALTGLTPIASNDDAVGFPVTQSRVQFQAVAGTSYQVVVNGFGAFDFGNFQFHQDLPNPGPVITTQPQGQTVNQGITVTFTVVATGGAPLSYQWRKDGVTIPNANASSLVLTGAQPGDSGTYSVVVTNPGGSVTSAGAVLVVQGPPQVTTHPTAQTVNEGEAASFSVVATGTGPLSYQWRRNGQNVPNATNSTLNLPAVTHDRGGLYSVVVQNNAGLAISQSALLTVRPRILSYERLPNGSFQFVYRATPGVAYDVLGSTDLMSFSSVGQINNTQVEQTFTDSTTTAVPFRFYILRRVAP